MASVFLSYANEDRARLAPLVERLEASGLSVFWDREIPPGTSWREVLGRELRSASCVLVAWSTYSVASEWVLEEAEEAKTSRRLIPVVIDEVELPIGFRAVQAVDLRGWSAHSGDERLALLVQALRQRTSMPDSTRPLVRPAVKKKSSRALVTAGVVGTLAVSLGGFLGRLGRASNKQRRRPSSISVGPGSGCPLDQRPASRQETGGRGSQVPPRLL
jgi:hypothetical protein